MATKKDNPHDRSVRTYLPPKYHRYFLAYTAYMEESKSSIAANIVRHFFDNMPQQEKDNMLRYYSFEQQDKSGI